MRTSVTWLLLQLTVSVHAQTASSVVDPQRFDDALLRRLVKEGVDSVRAKRKVQPLHSDSILYLAADNQAQYILKARRLTHYQSRNRDMRTVMQRVRAFGDDGTFVGENILYLYSGKNIRNSRGRIVILSTYRQAADEMISMRVRSSGHYRNLINRAYVRTGFAVAFVTPTQRIIAVQVLAGA
jgi:uncharacterized protein YkwD